MARQLDLLKGPRQRGTKAPAASEFAIHCMVADTLDRWITRGWRYSHIPSGEAREPVTGARLKRMGLKPGLFDLLLIDPNGRHYWLELKRKANTMSSSQLEWAAFFNITGVPHATAVGYQQAIDQLKLWGAVRASL